MRKLVLLTGLLLWVLPLSATMILPSKPPVLNDLASRAELIFKGICIDKKPGVYYFKVEEVLKGKLKVGETIDVRLYQTHFQVGKRYLLFLKDRDTLIGGRFGKYWIKEEKGEEVIENPFGLPEGLEKSEQKGLTKGGEGQKALPAKKIPFKDFKSILEKKSHD